jgi:lyso-ornithine lipid O-acyltransferase
LTLRRLRRAVALVLVLALCIVRYWFIRLRGPVTPQQRASWLRKSSHHVLTCLNARIQTEGEPPACGLVVANHLSYLDIPIISAAMPCCFVAKREIATWPFFGWAARTSGTLFLDRSSLASANAVAGEIAQRLKLPIPVLLFPEAKSSDGATVLPFHSRLIAPATAAASPITAVAIRYEIEGGIAERELCWFGNAGFLSHIWKVLGVPRFSAHLKFGEPQIYPHSRVAASVTHAEISAMREAAVTITQ